jgi:hypothetical protein
MDVEKHRVGLQELESSAAEQDQVAGPCEHGTEPAGLVQGEGFLE